MRSSLRAAVLGLVVAGLAVFILQNREVLELRFLGWEFQVRRAYMILVVFGAGLAAGWITATVAQLGARGRAAAATASDSTRPGPT